MWRRLRLAWRSLPEAVRLKRFAAPRCDFILGMGFFFSCGGLVCRRLARGGLFGPSRCLDGLSIRYQHHREEASVHLRRSLHRHQRPEQLLDVIELLVAVLAVGHLAPAEHHRDLDLVSVQQEASRILELELEVVLVRRGTHLDLLERGGAALALGLAGRRLLLLFVLVLAVVHDPADRRARIRRDLHPVLAGLLGQPPSLPRRHVGPLPALEPDHPDLAGADALVDARRVFLADWVSPRLGVQVSRRATRPARSATKASTATASPLVLRAWRQRTFTVPAPTSWSPSTSITGIFESSASRIL